MKKRKSFFAIPLLLLGMSVSACTGLMPNISKQSKDSEAASSLSSDSSLVSSSKKEESSEIYLPEAYKIYQLYLASGGKLTYEEWLETVRGEKGDPGHTYEVSIGRNGNWFIDGKDTGIHAQGPQGEKGETGEKGDTGDKGDQGDAGKSAYELYKETHPGYNKTEEEWLEDLLNGRLGEQITHKVYFNTKGGSSIAEQDIKHGEKASKPNDPTRPGYIFDGWTYLGEPWSFNGYSVTEDMILEANWIAIDYTATFVNDDGTVLETLENVHYGDQLVYSGATPVKPNPIDHCIYTFTGWDKELTVDGNMELIAQYSQEFVAYEEQYLDEQDNILYRRAVRKLDDNVVNISVTFNGVQQKSESGPIRFEAEDGHFVNSVDVEYHDDCSNGKSIGSFYDGSAIEFDFVSDSASTVKFGFSFARDYGVGTKVNQYLRIAVNGNQLDISDDVKLQSTTTWTDWEIVEVGDISVKAGNNNITLYAVEPINIDYLTLGNPNGFNPVGSVIEAPTKASADGIMYQFKNWYESSRTEDTVKFKPHFESCTEGLIFEKNQVYQYKGTAKEVYVPSYWNGSVISSVSQRAFEESNVEIVHLAEGIKRIEECAFRYCASLESIDLPQSLTSIEHRSFEYCSSLKSANIPAGVKVLTQRCFAECTSLETLTLPEGMTKLGNDSFWNCIMLKDLVLPSTLLELDMGTFLGCRSITSVNIPEGVKLVPNGCFADCRNLKSVTLPDSLETIASSAFGNCQSLSKIFIPMSVTTIEDTAFRDDPLLTIYCAVSEKPKMWYTGWSGNSAVVWGVTEEVTIEGYTYALANINEEKTAAVVSFDDSITSFCPPVAVNGYQVTNLARDLFFNHANLLSAVLPASVTYLDRNAFKDCPYLTYNVYGNSNYLGSTDGNPYFALIGPTSNSITSCIIHENCKFMLEYAFDKCHSLTSLTINNGISEIPTCAFGECDIRSLTIPASVKKIGNDAFHACCAMQTLVLNEGLEEIGSAAFSYSYSIQSVTFPTTLKKLGNDSFSQNYGLKYAKFLSSEPPHIGSNAFIYRWDNEEFQIIVPKGSLEAYRNIIDDSWQDNAVARLVEADE